jgi:hypothetical protein
MVRSAAGPAGSHLSTSLAKRGIVDVRLNAGPILGHERRSCRRI